MATIFRPEDQLKVDALYVNLPEPRPTHADFATYVYDSGGVSVVAERLSTDPKRVLREAVGAMHRHDTQKSQRRVRW